MSDQHPTDRVRSLIREDRAKREPATPSDDNRHRLRVQVQSVRGDLLAEHEQAYGGEKSVDVLVDVTATGVIGSLRVWLGRRELDDVGCSGLIGKPVVLCEVIVLSLSIDL